ncbi:MAG: helix-turn-helix transcriptional regulator, partial [Clostridia bacterium]|nr:helix-turn-helix transcriptional regulator [Clostridia bacterium]
MNLKIGENIKTFRIQRNITQEELATYLGVTPQAVSKWESQNGYPDIELIPSIADFFSVATDDLFGLNKAEKEVRKAEIHKDIVRMRCESHSEESVNKLREYVAEFPSDEIIQSQLANMLCNVYMWEEEKNIAPLKEAERIYITLIDTTKDADFRNNMLASLVKLY